MDWRHVQFNETWKTQDDPAAIHMTDVTHIQYDVYTVLAEGKTNAVLLL